MYYVYILKSLTTGEFYKGLTSNLERRLREHNSGTTQSTKHMRPLKLIHSQIVETLPEARKLEKYFKSGAGREIIKNMPSW